MNIKNIDLNPSNILTNINFSFGFTIKKSTLLGILYFENKYYMLTNK